MTTTNNALETICKLLAERKKFDAELQRRVIEEGDRLVEEQQRRHGLINAAVDLVRESREQ